MPARGALQALQPALRNRSTFHIQILPFHPLPQRSAFPFSPSDSGYASCNPPHRKSILPEYLSHLQLLPQHLPLLFPLIYTLLPFLPEDLSRSAGKYIPPAAPDLFLSRWLHGFVSSGGTGDTDHPPAPVSPPPESALSVPVSAYPALQYWKVPVLSSPPDF